MDLPVSMQVSTDATMSVGLAVSLQDAKKGGENWQRRKEGNRELEKVSRDQCIRS